MSIPLEISFHGMQPSPAIEARVREKVAKLERFYDRIQGCDVVIEAPHSHHHKGRLHHIRISLHLPGGRLVANREHHDNHAHEDLFVAMRDAFRAIQRQLEDFARQQRGAVKTHSGPPQGRISQLFPEQDYATIETSDGRVIYCHRNSVLPPGFEALEIGAPVSFVEEAGDQGPQASSVHLLNAMTAVA